MHRGNLSALQLLLDSEAHGDRLARATLPKPRGQQGAVTGDVKMESVGNSGTRSLRCLAIRSWKHAPRKVTSRAAIRNRFIRDILVPEEHPLAELFPLRDKKKGASRRAPSPTQWTAATSRPRRTGSRLRPPPRNSVVRTNDHKQCGASSPKLSTREQGVDSENSGRDRV
jgi:hypothetical protein